MATSKYGIARYQSAIKVSQLPPQDQQNPVHNNNPNSSANDSYPYNPRKQGAQEPVVTNTQGSQSSKPESADIDRSSGLGRLQAKLGLADLSKQTPVTQPPAVQNVDNSDNLKTAKKQQNMQDVNYKEMIPYLEKWQNRSFNRDATYAALSGLGASISGANANYKEWWSGGLVK